MLNRSSRILGFLSVVGLVPLAAAVTAQASVPDTVAVYQGIAHAAGVHAIYYTGTLTSFTTGAVDNRYPQAGVYQDISPSSNARASTQDYGPFVATVHSLQPGVPGIGAPSAIAQYPASTQAPADSVCDPNQTDPDHACNGGSAEAHARELQATAFGVYSGNATSTGAPAFNNATAETKTVLNPDGSITVTTHAHVSSATFGGDNGLVIKNVDVVTTVISKNGVGKATDVVAPGTATFMGQPVSITDQGATVGGQYVPGSGLGSGAGAGPLTFKVFTVAPEKSESGSHASVLATGTHVLASQDAAAGNQAAPPNRTEYVLGEGASIGFADPAPPPAPSTANLSLFPGGNDLGFAGDQQPTTTTTYAPPAATVTLPSNVVHPTTRTRRQPAPAISLASLSRPNLALLFFIWEAIVFATAASLVWRRRVGVAEQEI